ncbi:hypothetical protein ACFQ51_34850 [Streptomyces kaempferi]
MLGLVAARLVLQLLVAETVPLGVVVGLLQRGLGAGPLALRRGLVLVVLLRRGLRLRCLVRLRLGVGLRGGVVGRVRLRLVVDDNVGLVVLGAAAMTWIGRPSVR